MLPILYLDEWLVAIDKPSGLLVHRTGLDAGETRFAVQLLRDQIGRPVWPVHRLDKGTSGVLLFALDVETARLLGKSFEAGTGLEKRYNAIVRGWPPEAGTIDHPLRRMPDDMRVERAEIQEARTHFRSLERLVVPVPYGSFAATRCALVEAQPLTGRRHQIRRHMKHIAHPIIGDATHGKGPLNRALAEYVGHTRLWLHARSLTTVHPRTGQTIQIEAEPDAQWGRWMRFRDDTGPDKPSPTG